MYVAVRRARVSTVDGNRLARWLHSVLAKGLAVPPEVPPSATRVEGRQLDGGGDGSYGNDDNDGDDGGGDGGGSNGDGDDDNDGDDDGGDDGGDDDGGDDGGGDDNGDDNGGDDDDGDNDNDGDLDEEKRDARAIFEPLPPVVDHGRLSAPVEVRIQNIQFVEIFQYQNIQSVEMKYSSTKYSVRRNIPVQNIQLEIFQYSTTYSVRRNIPVPDIQLAIFQYKIFR